MLLRINGACLADHPTNQEVVVRFLSVPQISRAYSGVGPFFCHCVRIARLPSRNCP